VIAAAIISAAVVGTSAYQASEEKKGQKKALSAQGEQQNKVLAAQEAQQKETLAFQETQQTKLISYQEAQVKAAEAKVAGAEALATQEAKDKLRKQRLAQTKTILTSPLGIPSEANLELNTLLGGR